MDVPRVLLSVVERVDSGSMMMGGIWPLEARQATIITMRCRLRVSLLRFQRLVKEKMTLGILLTENYRMMTRSADGRRRTLRILDTMMKIRITTRRRAS
jgi:hypothetical protein